MLVLGLGALFVAAASCCGSALLRPSGRIEFLLGAAVIAYAEVVALSLALSPLAAYERRWFVLGSALLAAAALLAVAAVRPAWPSLRLGEAARAVVRDRLVAVLACIVAVALVYIVALALFTPPTEYDALTYHLTRAILWIQQQSVAPVAGVTDRRINDFPPNAEIVQAATMLLSGSVRWTAVVQVSSLFVAMGAIYGIAGRLGFGRSEAAFAALVFAALPVVSLQAPTALNDLMVAALVATTAFFALGRTRGELALGALALAALTGTKATAFLALPVLLGIVLLSHRGRWLALALGAGVAALIAGSVWYVVNLSRGVGPFGATADESGGSDGLVAMLARATRYSVETIEVPAPRVATSGCTPSLREASPRSRSPTVSEGPTCSQPASRPSPCSLCRSSTSFTTTCTGTGGRSSATSRRPSSERPATPRSPRTCSRGTAPSASRSRSRPPCSSSEIPGRTGCRASR